MKPGDLIEWKYDSKIKTTPYLDEELYSSVERRFIPVSRDIVHLLVSVDDETYCWINSAGVFKARLDDDRGRFAEKMCLKLKLSRMSNETEEA